MKHSEAASRAVKLTLLLWLAVFAAVQAAAEPPRTLRMAASAIKTLDPVLADDVTSRNFTAAICDTLLQYDYMARPYRLTPSMLAAMPKPSSDFTRYDFELRDDLKFAFDVALKAGDRKITSRDIKYSLLRLADARLHSPLYWMLRGKIKGLDDFHAKTARLPRGDWSIYDSVVPGFVIHDQRHFSIELTRSDPRFLYILAMPNAAIVSRAAVEFYGEGFARHPVGSGPFILTEWISDCKMVLERNVDYRVEYFPAATNSADRTRPLPLVDRVEVLLVKQPMSSWLLFLQGNLDFNELGKDNSDMISGGTELPPALAKRGIVLLRAPEFEIRYVGFNFNDPILGKNLVLRQALSLAYDVNRRVEHSGNQLIPAQSPLPPGVDGFDPNWINHFARFSPDEAAQKLAESGYVAGINPATGQPLELTFDQSGNTSQHRQYGELAVADFARIGLKVESILNNKPRFYDKLRQGRCQLFRLSWIGDYPDAENFLQLFYSGNIGGCNRIGFSDPEFDRMFEAALPLPDGAERTALYRAMVRHLAERCVWIYEGYPVSYLLLHNWLQNFHSHDFAFARLKYLAVDTVKRKRRKAEFRPLSLSDLRTPPSRNH